MFQPFDNPSQFYPGLIVWCDPNCREMDISTLAPSDMYDRKKARELRPCLVVAVNYSNQTFQVSRICATTPIDTRQWVRVDTAPSIAWRLNDAWIWVGTPPTLAMVFNNAKVMHPHKEIQFVTNPIAASNLQNYWTHRQNYLSYCQVHDDKSSRRRASTNYSTTHQTMHMASQSQSGAPRYLANPPSGRLLSQAQGFNTLSSQPVVVPPGFTETHPNSPGWWRNPETGWFWHASRGLLPPSTPK
ncbi:hypothetical protein MVEN_01596500 [Mycena venus]|uniref:Uncharacterized protein n=1 Tax=Mycena venus TaxID=2733690 RepID=A0A8H7CPV5_9AGAR|nr:hypothetical protein MVEN_01596500 [Mycena venus]